MAKKKKSKQVDGFVGTSENPSLDADIDEPDREPELDFESENGHPPAEIAAALSEPRMGSDASIEEPLDGEPPDPGSRRMPSEAHPPELGSGREDQESGFEAILLFDEKFRQMKFPLAKAEIIETIPLKWEVPYAGGSILSLRGVAEAMREEGFENFRDLRRALHAALKRELQVP